MKIPINEQETVIQISRDGDVANVWTSDQTVMTKLDKFLEQDEDCGWIVTDTGYSGEDLVSKSYRGSKKLISYRGHVMKYTMTDEQRQARIDRLKR